jgi:urease accessory protein
VQIGRSVARQGFSNGSLRGDLPDGPLLRHCLELGAGALADDLLAAPPASVSEQRCPDVEVGDAAGTTLTLAGGGCLSTWQGDRLTSQGLLGLK